MLVCHCGDPAKGNEVLKPLRALRPQQDNIKVASYLETQSTINPYTAAAHFQTNLFLPELSPAAIATITDATKNATSNTRVFIVPLYGAITRVPANETAFPLAATGLRAGPYGPLDRTEGEEPVRCNGFRICATS